MANADEVIKKPIGASENGMTFAKGEQPVLETEPTANATDVAAVSSGGQGSNGGPLAEAEKEPVRLNGSGRHESTIVAEFEEDSDEVTTMVTGRCR